MEEVVGKENIVEKQEVGERRLEMESFGTIIQMIDLSNSYWCIGGTNESTLEKDSSVALMHYDRNDLGSQILIRNIPKERNLMRLLSSQFLH